mmetsp:Transcript_14042/g.26244  ORF Transcript_14042/g.26244 Transcript_14042/m.26244 type:complete len:478 (-) Transcript_14042:26-1459(-)
MAKTGQRTISHVIEDIGYGPSQFLTSFLVNGSWLADGAELLVLSSIATSLADEWDLTPVQQGWLMSLVYLGVLVGNMLSGLLGDRFGRRVAVLLCFPMVALLSVASAWATSFWTLVPLRFFVGVGFGTGQPSAVAILMEISPIQSRALNQGLAQMAFAFGELYCCLVMWLDDPTLEHLNWRRMLMANAAPAVLFWLLSWALLQESPVFLAETGKKKQAQELLDQMRQRNGRPDANIHFESSSQTSQTSVSLWKQLPCICTSTTAVLCLVCFSYNATIYGAFTAFPQLLPQLIKKTGEGPVMELARGAFIEIPGDLFGLLAGLALPRKWVLYGYFVGLGISSVMFCCEDETLILLGYYGSKAFPQIGSVSLYILAAESFTTMVRACGTATVLSFGRIGAFSAPLCYEFLLSSFGTHKVFFYLSAFLMMVCFVLTAALVPESFHGVLAHTDPTFHQETFPISEPKPSHGTMPLREEVRA